MKIIGVIIILLMIGFLSIQWVLTYPWYRQSWIKYMYG